LLAYGNACCQPDGWAHTISLADALVWETSGGNAIVSQQGISKYHLKKDVHLLDAQEDGCHDGWGNT